MIEKVCFANLNLDPTICSNLTNFKENEKEVEKVVASINMYHHILTAIPAVIVSLFLGPWSDKNGRKPLIIFPQIGTIHLYHKYIPDISSRRIYTTSQFGKPIWGIYSIYDGNIQLHI